jgi:hypothetical protein
VTKRDRPSQAQREWLRQLEMMAIHPDHPVVELGEDGEPLRQAPRSQLPGRYGWGFFSIVALGGEEGKPGEHNTYVITDPRHPAYTTSVTVRHEAEGPVVVGLEVKGERLSPRDVKRLPLSSYIQAATAHRKGEKQALDKLKAPKGGPQRGRSTEFYREIADFYRALVAQGVRYPAAEIARRKRIDPGTVHQWIYRARELKFLERPTKSEGRTG